MLSVQDNLLIYARLHGVNSRDARARMRSIVDEFELGDKLSETVQDLSIGTKRRVQVAELFIFNAPIVFLDEASSGEEAALLERLAEVLREAPITHFEVRATVGSTSRTTPGSRARLRSVAAVH